MDASITQRIVAAAAEATEVITSAVGVPAPVTAAMPVAAMIAAAEVTNVTTGAGTLVRVTAAMVAALAEAGKVPTASIGASATGRSGWLSSKRT